MINKKIASEIAVGIIVFVALIVGGIFWLQNEKSTTGNEQLGINVDRNLLTEESQQACPENFYRICSNGAHIDDCNQQCESYDFENLNTDLWRNYQNDKLGFSMMIPRYNYDSNGRYDINVTESNGDIMMESRGQNKNIKTTINVRKVNSESDIDKFIQKRNYNSCRIFRKDLSSRAGVYELMIGSDDDNYSCSDFAYTLKYFPEKGIIAFWPMGQEGNFSVPKNLEQYNDDGLLDFADPIIAASFKFINNTSETMNWQTYRNEKYKFHLKYPLDWTNESGETVFIMRNDYYNFISGKTKSFNRAKGDINFDIDIYPPGEEGAYYAERKKEWDNLVSGNDNGNCTKFLIGGTEGFRCLFADTLYNSDSNIRYYFMKNETLFYATVIYSGIDSDGVGDRIISTLEFLNN